MVALQLQLAMAHPRVTTPAGMLALQNTVGNSAVVGLMGNGQVRPQVSLGSADYKNKSVGRMADRDGDRQVGRQVVGCGGGRLQFARGLIHVPVQRQMARAPRPSKVVTAFAASAYAFWKGRGTSTQPLEALGRFLVEEVNKQLPYPCGVTYDKSIDPLVATFDPRPWTIRLNMGQMTELRQGATVGQLKEDEVTEVVTAVYHEARHAQQYFRVAQMKMAAHGWAAVAAELEIDPLVAQTAWLTRTGDRKSTAEAKAWEPWVGPRARYATYKQAVQELTGQLKTLLEYLAPEYVEQKARTQRALRPTAASPAASARMEVQIASVVRKEILGEIEDEGTMTQAQASVRDLERAAAAIRRGGPQSQLDKAVLAQITGIKRAVAALQKRYTWLGSSGPGRNLPTLRSPAEEAYGRANAAYRGAPTEADAHRLEDAAARQFRAQARAPKR